MWLPPRLDRGGAPRARVRPTSRSNAAGPDTAHSFHGGPTRFGACLGDAGRDHRGRGRGRAGPRFPHPRLRPAPGALQSLCHRRRHRTLGPIHQFLEGHRARRRCLHRARARRGTLELRPRVKGQQPLRAMSNGCCGNEAPFTFRLCTHGYN
jgi:hypothetical protein